MWFNILPGYIIVAAGVAFPGFTLWWTHYLVLGNVSLINDVYFAYIFSLFSFLFMKIEILSFVYLGFTFFLNISFIHRHLYHLHSYYNLIVLYFCNKSRNKLTKHWVHCLLNTLIVLYYGGIKKVKSENHFLHHLVFSVKKIVFKHVDFFHSCTIFYLYLLRCVYLH